MLPNIVSSGKDSPFGFGKSRLPNVVLDEQPDYDSKTLEDIGDFVSGRIKETIRSISDSSEKHDMGVISAAKPVSEFAPTADTGSDQKFVSELPKVGVGGIVPKILSNTQSEGPGYIRASDLYGPIINNDSEYSPEAYEGMVSDVRDIIDRVNAGDPNGFPIPEHDEKLVNDLSKLLADTQMGNYSDAEAYDKLRDGLKEMADAEYEREDTRTFNEDDGLTSSGRFDGKPFASSGGRFDNLKTIGATGMQPIVPSMRDLLSESMDSEKSGATNDLSKMPKADTSAPDLSLSME